MPFTRRDTRGRPWKAHGLRNRPGREAPITSAASRLMEHQADVFALEAIGGRRDVAVSSFQTMAARNLSAPNPPAIVELLIS